MARKRLLIFAHYYVPDTASTGQILQDQAEGMLDEFEVVVICAVPSYGGTIESKYQTDKYYFEELNGVKIIRVRVPEFSKRDKISRIKNIIAYFIGALGASRKAGRLDYIFTISQPPILGGLLGVIGKWQKHAKMIYCIQDFNPEQIMAVKYSSRKLMLKAMMAMDKFSCRRSDVIITVGRDLCQTIEKRFKGKKVPRYVMINNWINEKEIYPLPAEHPNVMKFREKYGLLNKFVIMYSGNLGLYYDLENILKVIEKFKPGTKTADGREVIFAFVGAGAVHGKLVVYAKGHSMDNVMFIPYQDKADLNFSLNAGDVHWVVNAKGIKGISCPSKWYGIAGAARPVLGVLESGSEIRMLIEETQSGLVCEPGEYEEIEKNIRWFLAYAGSEKLVEMGARGRAYLSEKLTKDMSIQKYVEAIKEL